LNFSINSSDLLYAKPPRENKYSANFKLTYLLYSSVNSKEKNIVDSASSLYCDTVNFKKSADIISSINIKAKFNNSYFLKLVLTDINRSETMESYVYISKNNRNNRSNFQVTDQENQLIFQNNIKKNQIFKIKINDRTKNKLFVKYYKPNFPIATPPFSITHEKSTIVFADSSFKINLNDGETDFIELKKFGVYHFQTDSVNKSGLTLFRFYNDFPKIITPENMLATLRYLTSQQEYDKMLFMKDKKEALDKFWLEIAGNDERATELIRKYYNRVQDANKFFSSYLEGWKTDRGIVYIIYGPPNTVFQSQNKEVWVFGEAGNIRSVTMNFYKTENPFTENDYILEKSPMYKDSWFNSIDLLRR
jgi:GWxTD domain-containing protein